MSDPGEYERLLADVLDEGVSADFRDGLLDQTLRLARRRKRFREVRAAAATLAVLAGLGVLVWHLLPSNPVSPTVPVKPYTIVRTQPLPPPCWVVSKPLAPASIVASVRTGSVVVTATAKVPVRELNDDELLAIVPKPAALVRCGPHCAELVFVSQEDRAELLRY